MPAKLSFSYSKLGLYKECPKKYHFRYILKIPEKPKYYFAFGTALHKVMEFLYSAPAFPPLETALNFFKTDWNSTSWAAKGYQSLEKERAGFEEGLRIINAYYAKHQADGIVPLANEFRTTTDIDGLSVISILDRIDYHGEGKISILDYKTGKTLTREPDQLMMYQKLMSVNPKILNLVQTKEPFIQEVKIENMLFYHLPTLQEQAFEPMPKEQIDEFWSGVLSVADEIKAEKFNPDPDESKCRWCDYRDMCPVFGFADVPSPAVRQAAPQNIDKNPLEQLSAKIDEYGKLTAQALALKDEILGLMQKANYSIHYGKEFVAEVEEASSIDFTDKEKVVDILRQSGALKYALVPTLSSVKALLKGDKLNEEDKAKIKALAKEIKTFKLNCKKTQ